MISFNSNNNNFSPSSLSVSSFSLPKYFSITCKAQDTVMDKIDKIPYEAHSLVGWWVQLLNKLKKPMKQVLMSPVERIKTRSEEWLYRCFVFHTLEEPLKR